MLNLRYIVATPEKASEIQSQGGGPELKSSGVAESREEGRGLWSCHMEGGREGLGLKKAANTPGLGRSQVSKATSTSGRGP